MSHVMHSVARAHGDGEHSVDLRSLTIRAVGLTVLLVFATYLGITRLGYVRICWVPYVVPPAPAVLFLLILEALNVVLRALSRKSYLPGMLRPFSRGELLLSYAALAASLAMERGGYILHYLMFPQYYGTDTDGFAELFEYYPDFYIPHEPWVIKGFFEGTATGRVPWEMWWGKEDDSYGDEPRFPAGYV